MSIQVLKYSLDLLRPTTLLLPKEPQFVRFAMQRSIPTLWAIVNSDCEVEACKFEIFGTGHELTAGAEHVGSCEDGSFIWHLFEVPAHE